MVTVVPGVPVPVTVSVVSLVSLSVELKPVSCETEVTTGGLGILVEIAQAPIEVAVLSFPATSVAVTESTYFSLSMLSASVLVVTA